MNDPQRMMTLVEIVGRLPSFHVARKEFDALKTKLEAMERALNTIAELEYVLCNVCQGNGAVYADGRAHFPRENAPTIACGNCGGEGKLPPEDAIDVAQQALAAAQEEQE